MEAFCPLVCRLLNTACHQVEDSPVFSLFGRSFGDTEAWMHLAAQGSSGDGAVREMYVTGPGFR